ncbi:hypothetical protein [Mesorhizobium amorphae]|uniref:hypothetical protein n=1 Tax=Mesorhizobium amorphae TaxID=71433 RepID=UPI001781881A|nr:hypothetical protein [Mesorhizobium amorphae]
MIGSIAGAGRFLWQGLLATLFAVNPGDMQMIDSTTAKEHRSAASGKGCASPRWQDNEESTPSYTASDGRTHSNTPGQLGDLRAATASIAPLPPALFLAVDMAHENYRDAHKVLKSLAHPTGFEPVMSPYLRTRPRK